MQSDLEIKRATNTYPRYRYFSTRETVFAGTLFAIFVRYSAANICTNIYILLHNVFPVSRNILLRHGKKKRRKSRHEV